MTVSGASQFIAAKPQDRRSARDDLHLALLVHTQHQLVRARHFRKNERIAAHVRRNVAVFAPVPGGVHEQVLVVSQADDGERHGGRGGREHDRISARGVHDLPRRQRDRVGIGGEAKIRALAQTRRRMARRLDRHGILVEHRHGRRGLGVFDGFSHEQFQVWV